MPLHKSQKMLRRIYIYTDLPPLSTFLWEFWEDNIFIWVLLLVFFSAGLDKEGICWHSPPGLRVYKLGTRHDSARQQHDTVKYNFTHQITYTSVTMPYSLSVAILQTSLATILPLQTKQLKSRLGTYTGPKSSAGRKFCVSQVLISFLDPNFHALS